MEQNDDQSFKDSLLEDDNDDEDEIKEISNQQDN
jgi:hypothetical protein